VSTIRPWISKYWHQPAAISLLLLTALALASPTKVLAQGDEANTEVTVNYVYATQLGIGGYEVGGLDVKIFTVPFSYTFDLERDRDDIASDSGRPWRLKLSAPVNYGVYDFSATDVDGSPVTAELETLSLIPGAELQIPLGQRWTLKPHVDAGVGRGLAADSQYAYIYTVGVTSLYQQQQDKLTLMFGNGLLFAGNAIFGEGGESYSAIKTGLGVRHPIGLKLRGLAPDLGLYGIYYYYYPRALVFQRFLQSPLTVNNQFEIALSLGSSKPLKLGPFINPRVGISYIFGDSLEITRINFGFPF
jgi:hypothetical protein